MLTIHSLGPFYVKLDGQPFTGASDIKRELLLTYLAENGNPQPRKEMARLLWPDVEDPTALSNLRSLLTRMRQEGLAPFFFADRRTVSFNFDADFLYDAGEFRTALTGPDCTDLASLHAAMALYTGKFLDGVSLPNQPELETWIDSVQRDLERLATFGYQRLITMAMDAGDTELAIRNAHKALDITPYNDAIHLLLMRALAAEQHQASAVQHYEQYRKTLKHELNIDQVAPELSQLAAQLRHSAETPTGDTPPITLSQSQTAPSQTTASQTAPPPDPTPPRPSASHLPAPVTPLLNRESELARLLAWVRHDHWRLITIHGLGGVGKTHLALELGHLLYQDFPDGVWFVDIAGESTKTGNANTHDRLENNVDRLVHLIARALDLHDTRRHTADEQLLDALRTRQICLILDNFESLIPAAPFLIRLLSSAPAVTLIVTSRQRLNLNAERAFTLHGLPIPDTEDRAELAASGAVQLLLSAQNQFDSYTAPTETVLAAARVGRLVDGHPLSLLMAAPWLEHISLDEIADCILSIQSFLETSAADIPVRQSSIHGIFEEIWPNLTPKAQLALAQLSVISGRFYNDDAEAVAGTTLLRLRELTDLAFLTLVDQGCYQFHPLVRQFARQKLAAIVDDQGPLEDRVLARHAEHYFARMMEESQSDTAGERPRVPYQDIDAALNWLLSHDPQPVLDQMHGVVDYCRITGQTSRTPYWLEKALDLTTPDSADRAEILRYLGTYHAQHHHSAQAEQLLIDACQIYRKHNHAVSLTKALGQIAWSIFGQSMRRADAETWFSASVDNARQTDNKRILAEALFALGFYYTWYGSVRAEDFLAEALAIASTSNHRALIPSIRSNQFYLAQNRNDRQVMHELYEELKSLANVADNSIPHAWEMYRLSEHALVLDFLDDAEHFANQAMAEFTDAELTLGILHASYSLATCSLRREHWHKATVSYRKCATAASEEQNGGLCLLCFLGLADAALAEGEPAEAARLLGQSERLRERLPVDILPVTHTTDGEQQKAMARQRLGDRAFVQHWQAGYEKSDPIGDYLATEATVRPPKGFADESMMQEKPFGGHAATF